MAARSLADDVESQPLLEQGAVELSCCLEASPAQTASAEEPQKEVKGKRAQNATVFFILSNFLFLLAASNLDVRPYLRQVKVPTFRSVVKHYSGHWTYSDLVNVTEWNLEPTPPGFNATLLEERPEIAVQRFWYWCPLMGGQQLGVTAMGTLIMRFPVPCVSDGEHDHFSSVHWEMMTYVTVVLLVVVAIWVTYQAYIYQQISLVSGLSWEYWHYLQTLADVNLLTQAVSLRISKPNQRYGWLDFIKGSFTLMFPFTSDGADTVKDCIFASTALSTGTPTSQVIGATSFLHTAGLHAWMLRDRQLQVELRASHLAILNTPDLPDRPEASASQEQEGSTCFARCCGWGLLSLQDVGRTLWDLVLPTLYNQSKRSRVPTVLGEDVVQGGLAASYALHLCLSDEAAHSTPSVALLQMVLPLVKLSLIYFGHKPIGRMAYGYMWEQFFLRLPGNPDYAEEIHSEIAQVRKWDGDNKQRHFKAVKALGAKKLTLEPAVAILASRLDQALKNKQVPEALEVLEDLLIACVLDTSSFVQSMQSVDEYNPANDTARLAEEVGTKAASKAAELFWGLLPLQELPVSPNDSAPLFALAHPFSEFLVALGKTLPRVEKAITTAFSDCKDPDSRSAVSEEDAGELGVKFLLMHLMLGAAEAGKADTIRVLFDHGTQPDLQNAKQETPLMKVCRSGHVETATMLIAKGAKLDLQDSGGSTALMLACDHGHVEIATTLISKGAKLDLQESDGWTALIYACYKGHTETAAMLIERGAALDHQAKDGRTALMLACQEGHVEIATTLIAKGAELDLQNSNGWTALIWACCNGLTELATMMIDHGASVDHQANDGRTALMLAGYRGRADVVELLLARNANMTLKNNAGRTALDMVREEKETDRSCIPCFDLLAAAEARQS